MWTTLDAYNPATQNRVSGIKSHLHLLIQLLVDWPERQQGMA